MSNPTLHTRAIIRPEDVERAALDSLESRPEELNHAGAINTICNAVTERVEGRLGRRLIVHHAESFYEPTSWSRSPRENYGYERYVDSWPLLQVTTTSASVALGESKPGGQKMFANSNYSEVSGFAGFIRRDHVGANDSATLSTINGWSHIIASGKTLTVVPDTLPEDIVEAAAAIALIRILKRIRGAEDGSRRVHQVAGNTVVVESNDPRAEERILESIDHYRVL